MILYPVKISKTSILDLQVALNAITVKKDQMQRERTTLLGQGLLKRNDGDYIFRYTKDLSLLQELYITVNTKIMNGRLKKKPQNLRVKNKSITLAQHYAAILLDSLLAYQGHYMMTPNEVPVVERYKEELHKQLT